MAVPLASPVSADVFAVKPFDCRTAELVSKFNIAVLLFSLSIKTLILAYAAQNQRWKGHC